MFKLPNLVKCTPHVAFNKVRTVLYAVLLLFVCGQVNAQTVSAVINPTGGTSATDDIKIEVYNDGGIKVTRKGLLESYIRTDSAIGMRSFFDFKNNTRTLDPANLKSPSICYISPISGTGTYADPYQVQIVGTIVEKYKNYPTGQTGTVTCILSYVKNTRYFFMDWILHLPTLSSGTRALFYLSEQSVMGADASADPDVVTQCGYGFTNSDSTTIGIFRDTPCSGAGTSEAPRSHVYRTFAKFHSFEASIPGNRFLVDDNGYFPGNTIANAIDGRGRSLAVMRELGAVYNDAFSIDPANFKTFRVLSGYGTTKTEFDTVAAVKDSIPEAGFVPATVQFSSASLSGNEGSSADGEHVAAGITLKVSGGKLNAPAYVLVQVDNSVSYPHPAVANTDYKLVQEGFLVPAGDYTTPKTITIPNLHVIGNDQLQYSRTLRLKLVATCTSLLSISGTSEADYTIVDDEARSMVMSIDSASLYEGNSSKGRITVSSGAPSPEDIVITFSRLATSTAGDTDYILPASVTIPANQSSSADFIIKAKSDKTLENTEKATIKFTGTMLGIPVTGQKDLNILDSTYYNPNYAKILMDFDNPSAASPVPEGYVGNVSLHLPAGVSTEVPINMASVAVDNASPAVEDIDFTLNTYSGLDFTIYPGTTSTDVPFEAILDKLIEGPTPEQIILDVVAVDNVGAGRTYPLSGPNLAISDVDYDVNMKVIVTAVPTTIKEGDAGTTVTIALPNGIKTNTPLVVNIAQGLSSTASLGDLVAALPASVTILKNKNSIAFPAKVQAKTDNLLENDESLWIVTKPTGFVTDSSMITIQDATGDVAANRQLTIQVVNTTLLEGTSSDIKVSFTNPAITAQNPVTINFNLDPSSLASATDFSLPSPFVLPANTNSITFSNGFKAVTDNILEADEPFTLQPVSTSLTLTLNTITGIIQDATGDYPANKVITATPSATQMDEGGSGYSYTYSLPAGITTEIPIQISPVLITTGSTASTDDYTLAANSLTLDKTNNNSISTGISIAQDGLIEGDETLVLGGIATSTAMTGFQVVAAPIVTLKDKDKLGGIAISTDKTQITEGATGAYITVKLPNGYVPPAPVTVTLSAGLSSQATNGYTGLPQTVTMTGNSVMIPVPVAATTDNIIGDNYSLVIVVNATGFPPDSIALQIIDATVNDPNNTRITLTPQPLSEGSHVMEGNFYTVRASFPSGVVLAQPVTMTITASSQSAADASDYTGLPATVTISPTTGYGDFTISPIADNVIEGSELVKLIGTVTSMTGIANDSLNFFIDDATLIDPAKSTLQIVFDSTTVHKGSFTMVRIGFVNSSVTSTEPISINVSADPSSTADLSSYSGIPAVVTLPADSNYITLFLNIGDNHKLEGPTVLQFDANSTGFTIAPIAPVNIVEYNGAALSLAKIADAGEPSTDGAFMIKMPSIYPTDVTVRLNSAYNSTNIQSVPISVTVPAGSDHLTLPVKVIDDKILQGDQILTITLQSATTITGGAPVVLTVDITPIQITVTDDESATTGPKAIARQVLIEKRFDAQQPTTNGSFRIRFNDSTLTVTQDVNVTYSVGGTATPTTDYTTLSGAAVIPAGQSSVLVPVIPSGITYAGLDLSVVAQLQQATSSIPNVGFALDAHAKDSVIIINRNVDTPQVNLSALTSTLTEGDTMLITVRTTQSSVYDLFITIGVICDNFRTISYNGSQINGRTFQFKMPAGSSQQSFKLKVDDNDISDDDGFIQVTTKPFDPLTFTPPYKIGTAGEIKNVLLDNDSMDISFTANQYDVKVPFDTLNKLLPFTLRMNRTTSRIVTLYYEFYTPANGELLENTQPAEEGKDYDNTVTPILILPGQTDAQIPVFVNSVERNKMFGVRLLRTQVTSNQHVPSVDSIVSATGVIMICMECDVDGDGVPDYVERYLTDGRWKDNNQGNLRVSPAVSPNHDGVGNDAMYVENIDAYPDNDVTIINRWGGVVFTTKGYNNATNNFSGIGNAGSAKGQDVADGSYFFIIHATDPSGKKISYTGYIVIKR